MKNSVSTHHFIMFFVLVLGKTHKSIFSFKAPSTPLSKTSGHFCKVSLSKLDVAVNRRAEFVLQMQHKSPFLGIILQEMHSLFDN